MNIIIFCRKLFSLYRANQIYRLDQRVGLLSKQGRYGQAIDLAIQSRDLTYQSLGKNHPDYAASLNNLAVLYESMGNYAAAIPLHTEAIQIKRIALEQNHPDYALSLNNLATLYRSMGNYAAAEPLCKQAMQIRLATLGEGHPDYALSMNNMAALYESMGNYATAEPLYVRALEIRRVALGEDHPSYAISLNNLAMLYRLMGNYAAVEPLYRQAMQIIRVALGEDHPNYAISLNNLATLYRSMGNYAAAKPLYNKVIQIRRAVLGEDHPDYATSLNNLAGLYASMGNYASAESLFNQSMQISRVTLGEHHPIYATSLNNLAVLYKSMGDYAAAIPLYVRAIETRRVVLGEDHPDYATSLNNMALLYDSMGDYIAAIPLYQQAMQITIATLGEGHPDYADSLDNQAAMYGWIGNYAVAESLYIRAMDIRGASLGEDHPSYALSLNNLAVLYASMGNYAAAEPLCDQVIQIRLATLGEGHPDYADSLNNLAALYKSMGNYAAAEPLYRQAMQIRRDVLGEDHPNYAAILNNLALLLVSVGRTADAFVQMEQASAIDDRVIGQIFSFGSETQRMAFLETVRGNFEGFLSLIWEHLGGSIGPVNAALDLVLRRKTIDAEVQAARRDALLGGKYPHLKPRLEDWFTLRSQIALKTLAGPGPDGLEAHRQRLAEWNHQKERLEAELVRQVPEMNLERNPRAADRRAVALGLPEGVTLVEFVRFNVFDFHAVPARAESQWKPARYLAFVLPAGKPDEVRMVDLGEAEPIDRMIADFREGIAEAPEDRPHRNVTRLRPSPVSSAPDDPGPALRAAVFEKLLPALGDCKRLLVAPDGDLSRLPFEVLSDAHDRLVVDDGITIDYVNCGRDVLRFGAAFTGQPSEAVVAADPDYDLNGITTHKQLTTAPSPGRRSRDLGDLKFPAARLPATRVEGERIAAMLGVRPWLDSAVLEGRLRAECRSPRILHLATHGFFLEDRKRDPNRDCQDFGGLETPGRMSGPLPENPLLRAGLLLAGANTWHATGEFHPDAEDGLLTAEDVSGLDLLATELVVLSACETGLGQVRTGEGVFGLQRAFVLAGAKTLVMSLWAVPDLSTAILMERFYENLLAHKLGRADSLRQAQAYIRTLTLGAIRETWLAPAMIDRLTAGDANAEKHLRHLTQQVDDHRPFADPYYWGAFICQGNPGALPTNDLQE